MLSFSDALSIMQKEVRYGLYPISEEGFSDFTERISSAKRVFVAGAGRSLLMMRCFAMRLMQLGHTAFVVGDTTTPAIGKGDILVIGSGSGETATMLLFAEEAKKNGAEVLLLTENKRSSLAKMADGYLCLENVRSSRQVGNSAFEQGLLFLCEAVIMRLAEKTQANEILWRNHANLQ